MMNPNTVIFCWPLAVMAIFALLPPRRAILTSMLLAWLFLPIVRIDVPIFPDVTKMSMTLGAILIGIVVFDLPQIRPFHISLHWIDLPFIIWCLAPFLTAIANAPETKLWDGVSWSFDNVIGWGLPYLIGRTYFSSVNGLRQLAAGIFIGGLIYIPLCLFEMKMSPQLHRMLYGAHQHDFLQSVRGDGYRPTVFMTHGLAVAMFMGSASICGLWLWVSGALKEMFRFLPAGLIVMPLIATSLLMRSAGAISLMLIGLGAVFLRRTNGFRVFLMVLLLIPATYITARTIFGWDGSNLVEVATEQFGPERAQSLDFRFRSEELMLDKIDQRAAFGWGGYGRSLVLDSEGKVASVPDSFWVIAYGLYGSVGLVSELLFTWPIIYMLFRIPRSQFSHPALAGVLAMASLLTLYAIDNLVNSMPNPIFILGLGGLCGLCTQNVWRYIPARSMVSHHVVDRVPEAIAAASLAV